MASITSLLRVSFGLMAYLLAMTVLTYASVWATNAVVNFPALKEFYFTSIDGKPVWDLNLPTPAALFWNFAAFYFTFAVQHNTMARSRVKRHMRKVVPFALERSLFLVASAMCLVIVMCVWQPMPAIVWKVGAPLDKAIYALSIISYLLHFASTFAVDHLELLGVKQAWAGQDEHTYPRAVFVCNAFYWFVRHPIYTTFLSFNFAAPIMSVGRLEFCLILLAFVLWSIPLEEQEIVDEVGEAYLHYRAHVPALLPTKLTPYKRTPMHANTGAAAAAGDAAAGGVNASVSVGGGGGKKAQ